MTEHVYQLQITDQILTFQDPDYADAIDVPFPAHLLRPGKTNAISYKVTNIGGEGPECLGSAELTDGVYSYPLTLVFPYVPGSFTYTGGDADLAADFDQNAAILHLEGYSVPSEYAQYQIDEFTLTVNVSPQHLTFLGVG